MLNTLHQSNGHTADIAKSETIATLRAVLDKLAQRMGAPTQAEVEATLSLFSRKVGDKSALGTM